VGRADQSSTATRIARGILDTILAAGLLYMIVLIGSAAVDAAKRRTQLRLLVAEAGTLYDAMQIYNKRNHGFPATYSQSSFDAETFDPLRRRGYYKGPITSYLYRGRADAYDSPDDLGPNREFWVELTLASDPAVRVLVAQSDDAPLGGGDWRDGVFVYRDGVLHSEER
jgi:hypothetical protein